MTTWEKWQLTWRSVLVIGVGVYAGVEEGWRVGLVGGFVCFGFCFMGWARTPRWKESEAQRAARHVREQRIREEIRRGERKEPWQ